MVAAIERFALDSLADLLLSGGEKMPPSSHFKAHHLASLLPLLPPDLAAHARSHAEQHFAILAASHGQERALSILSAGLESVPVPADVTKAAPLLGAAELYLRLRGEGKSLAPVTLWLASDDADAASLAGHFADVPLGRIYCGLGRKAQAMASVVARERAAVTPTGALQSDRVLSFLQAAIEEADGAGTLIIAPPEVLQVGKAWLEAGQPEIGLPLPRGGRVGKGAVLHVEGSGREWQVKTQAVASRSDHLDRQGGELPIVDRTSLERADFITYPEGVQGSNCSSCMHNANGACQFHGEVAGQSVDLRGQPVNERNCCSGWDARGTLRAWRDRAKADGTRRKMLARSDVLLNLPDVPQQANYDCGAAAVMSICRFFGVGSTDEKEYVRRLPSTPSAGTPPVNILAFFATEGVHAEARQHMTVADLEHAWRQGWPVLCCIQDYGSPEGMATLESGHWVVVIGAALGFIFVQDPSADFVFDDSGTDAAAGRKMIALEKWEQVWQDRDEAGTIYDHYGIVVQGPVARRPPVIEQKSGDSFFSTCDRDEGGHCKPGSGSGKKPADKPGKKPVAKPDAASHPGAAHGSNVKIKLTKKPAAPRDANGKIRPIALKTQLTKQETGRVTEAVIRTYLRDIEGISDTVALNAGKANESIDLFGDSMAPEIKGGLASNGEKAQQWRITFSMELGKKEQAEYDAMSDEQQKAWREKRQRACLERKVKLLKQLSKERGKPIKPVTFTGIVNPDTKTVDIYKTEGYHQRIGWNDPQAKYVASVNYDHA